MKQRQKKKKEITLGSLVKWLKSPNRSHDGPCAQAFSRLHGELQLRADTKAPMEGPFLEWLAVDVVQLIQRLKAEVGDPLVLPMNAVIEIVHTDDPDWTLYNWMLETRLVVRAMEGMLPQQARDYKDAKLRTPLLAKLKKALLFHRLWGRDNSAGVHLTAKEVRELIHRLPAEIDIPEGVDARFLRLSDVVQMFGELGSEEIPQPDVKTNALKHVEHVEPPKVVLVIDQAIADVYKAVESSNKKETTRAICQRIAKRDGLNPESLRSQFNRWRKYEGLNTR